MQHHYFSENRHRGLHNTLRRILVLAFCVNYFKSAQCWLLLNYIHLEMIYVKGGQFHCRLWSVKPISDNVPGQLLG